MKKPYRVGEGANLEAFPHGTKVGHVVMLTEAQAAYERDMGRIAPVEGEPIPGITKGYPADAVTGEALELTDEQRASIQAGPDIGEGSGEAVLGQGRMGERVLVADEEGPFPDATDADSVVLKSKRRR